MSDIINILVVDDKEANRITVEELLKENIEIDFNVLQASNGEEALKITLEEENITLIILDIQMPVMDGFEVAKYLKSTNKTKYIPILFLTAVFKSEEFTQKGFDLGAVDYMTKPIDENQFINRVKLYLKLFQKEKELKKYQFHLEEMVEEKTNQLKQQYITDNLTGLFNKVHLDKILSLNKTKTILLLDIDNFGIVNDNYGFEIGDKLLVKIANILKNINLPNKIEYDIFRLQSDEFIYLIDNDKNKEYTLQLAQYIKDCFSKNRLLIDGIEFNITFTMGIDYGKGKDLLRNAGLSIHEIRQFGKNKITIYDANSEFKKHQENNIYWITRLIKFLENHQIKPFYQPILDLRTEKILKYESLARVLNENEIIGPNKFLGPAKLAGLIVDITKNMIEESFKYIQNKNITISINITEQDFKENYLIAYLEEKRKLYKIDTNQVVLEILESISINKQITESLTQQLKDLKKLGYKISIDDFGTENSNFSRLLTFDVDFIKIDGSFIKSLDTDKNSQKIVQAIVHFAHSINAKVIAEFVHNKKIYEKIKEYDIDYAQGYYIGKPKIKILNRI